MRPAAYFLISNQCLLREALLRFASMLNTWKVLRQESKQKKIILNSTPQCPTPNARCPIWG